MIDLWLSLSHWQQACIWVPALILAICAVYFALRIRSHLKEQAQRERDRQAEEQKRKDAEAQREREAEEKRQANKKHRALIHVEIRKAILENLIERSADEGADALIEAIKEGRIPHVSIAY